MSFFSFTKTVLKSLFSKPATLMYPFTPRQFFDKSRGRLEIDIKACIYCGACQRKCPSVALAVNRQEKTWKIDRMRCVSCNACVEVCPTKCLKLATVYYNPIEKPVQETFHA